MNKTSHPKHQYDILEYNNDWQHLIEMNQQLTSVEQFKIDQQNFQNRPTLLSSHEQQKSKQAVTNLTNSNDDPIKTVWFPSVTTASQWDVEELQRDNGEVYIKPASIWSTKQINKLYYLIEKSSNERQQRSRYIKTGHNGRNLNNNNNNNNSVTNQFNRVPMSKLIQYTNRTIGFNNWDFQILENSTILRSYESTKVNFAMDETDDIEDKYKYSVTIEIDVKLKLIDGTTIIKRGIGHSYDVPLKSFAFRKAKKESITDGLKSCLYGLVELLMDYEGKCKEGYFKPYIDDENRKL